MTILFNDSPLTVPNGMTLPAFVSRFSPFADEPVLILHNDAASDADSSVSLCDGDRVSIYPRLIGG